MEWVEIVCLANSRKLGGRCVAGLRLDTGAWIRPVSDRRHGELYYEHYGLDTGPDISLLDIARVPIERASPLPEQPENWLVSNDLTWRFVRKAGRDEAERILGARLVSGPELLGGTSDRVPEDGAQPTSLALLEPAKLAWRVTENVEGRRQLRAEFELGAQPYSLTVTDPEWESKTGGLPPGVHPPTVGGTKISDRIWFTVSLSEAYKGYCFKLVAAVIRLPRR